MNKQGKPEKYENCDHCNTKYLLQPSGATTQFNRHMQTCLRLKRFRGEKTKGAITFGDNSSETNLIPDFDGPFDHMKSRELLARIVIAYELPFMFVKY